MTIYQFVFLGLGQASASVAQLGGFGGFQNYPNSNSGSDSNAFNGFPFSAFESFFSSGLTLLTAHAVLASLAFVFFFPVGGMLIRLGTFPGLWIVHGAFQIFAYCLYVAAAGLGLYVATHLRMLNEAHPVIGILLLVLLFFQPFLGFLHHFAFKKCSRRTAWSYGHLWLGRVAITLGTINGGLGLQLAKRTGIGAPSENEIIAYGVVAGIIWVVYVGSAIVGERRRARVNMRGTERLVYTDEGKIDEVRIWR